MITVGEKKPMEKGNRYGKRERKVEDESNEAGVGKTEREREREKRKTCARFSLLVSHGLVFMNGFARGLRGIVLSLLPPLSRSLFPSRCLSLYPIGVSARASFSGGLLQTLTHRGSDNRRRPQIDRIARNRHRVPRRRRRRRHCRRLFALTRLIYH